MALLRRRTLHLVRHAESNWNVLTAGEHIGAHPHLIDVDSDLSPKGEAQLETLRQAAPLAPPLELILASPLRRALRTAVALRDANGGAAAVPMRVEPRATEWLENSCDCGRPGVEIQRDFGDSIQGLAELGDSWWPQLPKEDAFGHPRGGSATLAALASGGREPAASVDLRCSQLLDSLLYEFPQTSSIAVVAHCMVLHKLETMLRQHLTLNAAAAGGDSSSGGSSGSGGSVVDVEYLDNTEVRSIVIESVVNEEMD
jgi:broad specificity phosphatase PhoE